MTTHPFIRSAVVKSAKSGFPGRFILSKDQLRVVNADASLPEDNMKLDLGPHKEALGEPAPAGGFIFRVTTKQPMKQ